MTRKAIYTISVNLIFKFDEEFLNRQVAQSELAKCEEKIAELQAELEAFRTQVKDPCYVLLFFIGSRVGALLFNLALNLRSNDTHFLFHYEMVFLFCCCYLLDPTLGLTQRLLHWLADTKSNENAGHASLLAIFWFSLRGNCS